MTDLGTSERAEAAASLLFQTLGAFRRQELALSAPRAQLRLGDRAIDPAQVRMQSVLIRLVSITEAFCAERLVSRAEVTYEPASNALTSLLWEDAAKDVTGSWPKIKAAFQRWHNATPDWLVLDGYAEVRNAIAHGLGRLTRRQIQTLESTKSKIARTSIDLTENEIRLVPNDLRDAAIALRKLILEVDSATWKPGDIF